MHLPILSFDKSLLPIYAILCVQPIVEGPNTCQTGSKAVFPMCQKTTILVPSGFPKRTEVSWSGHFSFIKMIPVRCSGILPSLGLDADDDKMVIL